MNYWSKDWTEGKRILAGVKLTKPIGVGKILKVNDGTAKVELENEEREVIKATKKASYKMNRKGVIFVGKTKEDGFYRCPICGRLDLETTGTCLDCRKRIKVIDKFMIEKLPDFVGWMP